MNIDLTFNLIYNLSMLLVFSFVFSIVNNKIGKVTKGRDFLAGLLIAGIGLTIMINPVPYTVGIIYDGRSILLSMTGLFFGVIPTMIAVLVMGLYRIFLGGAGMVAGLATILSSTAIGFIWRKYRLKKFILDKENFLIFELYVFGIVVHSVMLFNQFLLLPNGATVARDIMGPVILLFPIATVISGLIIRDQIDKNDMIVRLAESEERYRTIFENVNAAMIVIDALSGKIVAVNPYAADFYGYARETLIGKPMWEISNIGSEAIMERIEITIKESKSEFIAEHIRSDGTYRDVEVHASPVKIDNQLMAFLVVHDITERMRREKEIEYLSFHDQLTGLYNRRFFETEMKRLDTARNLPIAIVMADVNGLKMMNDAFGHQAGDDLLIQAKDVMKSAIRQDDILSRVGGDEFVLLLPKTKLSNAQDLIKRMKHQLEFCQINGMAVSVSFGVAVKEQEDTSIYDTYQKAEDSMYKNKFFESRQLKGNMIDTIMKTLYEKNPRERNHAERVSELCRGMASYLELTEDEINEIGVAGLLHDIGKITLDEVILNKPGFLTESEWKQMRKHPEAGYKILTSVNGLTTIGDYILFHHERWDGTGYPNGIRGEETPYISRIIGLADAFDAMVEDRPYRPTMTYEEAIEEIRGNAGTQFDPILADKFIEWLNTF